MGETGIGEAKKLDGEKNEGDGDTDLDTEPEKENEEDWHKA